MAKPGDIVRQLFGHGVWTYIYTEVDDKGIATGGWLIPPGQPKKLIDALVQEAKRLAGL